MSLMETMVADMTAAMKAKDADKLPTLRMVKANLMNRKIEKGSELTDEEVTKALQSLVKQRRDSIEQYENAGRTEAPQFTGGGAVHGPTPRDYSQRTPKKMKAAALRGALSDRARHGKVLVVSSLLTGEAPSTKSASAALAAVSDAARLLAVLDRSEELTWKSLRNVDRAHLLWADQLNTYDVLCADSVVFTSGALDAFLAGPARGKGAKATGTSEAAGTDEEASK